MEELVKPATFSTLLLRVMTSLLSWIEREIVDQIASRERGVGSSEELALSERSGCSRAEQARGNESDYHTPKFGEALAAEGPHRSGTKPVSKLPRSLVDERELCFIEDPITQPCTDSSRDAQTTRGVTSLEEKLPGVWLLSEMILPGTERRVSSQNQLTRRSEFLTYHRSGTFRHHTYLESAVVSFQLEGHRFESSETPRRSHQGTWALQDARLTERWERNDGAHREVTVAIASLEDEELIIAEPSVAGHSLKMVYQRLPDQLAGFISGCSIKQS